MKYIVERREVTITRTLVTDAKDADEAIEKVANYEFENAFSEVSSQTVKTWKAEVFSSLVTPETNQAS